MRARLATVDDSAAICRIYNEGIADRIATFETRPRVPDEIRAWFDGAHPIVVVERAAEVIAFAASSSFRARECYAGIADFAVYVARDTRGAGAGRLAMRRLVDEARAAGYWKLLSGVLAENGASRAMLRAVGFREVGVYERHAQLDGRWRDVVIVELLTDGRRADDALGAPALTVLFACVHNAGRSQMAAAWLTALADPARARAVSAGTRPGERVHAEVVAVMREVGIDLASVTPRLLTPELAASAQLLVTMGCGDACPVVPGLRHADWPLDDPKGQPLEIVRAIRDEIRARVQALVDEERVAR
jgi:L-amino acid N-acyltransferase YncA/protein-tyrosine-phosphatase